MKTTADRMSVRNGAAHRGAGRIAPLRPRRGLFLPAVVAVAACMILDVYLNVKRVRFGQDIQLLRQEVSDLGSEVRDMEGQKAGMTSLPSIEQRAREMGMVYPRSVPQTLVVELPRGEVPPTWAIPSPHMLHPEAQAPDNEQLALANQPTGRGE